MVYETSVTMIRTSMVAVLDGGLQVGFELSKQVRSVFYGKKVMSAERRRYDWSSAKWG